MTSSTDAKKADTDSAKKSADDETPIPEERSVTTEHAVSIGGRTLEYEATTGTLHLTDDAGKPRAAMFHVAYVKRGVKDPSTRPITFAFNGGPGSSAVWLQLGTFGPRRVKVPDAAAPPPPPYELVDNEHSLLDVTDLVFIDPVGTGYSRALGKAERKDFLGVKEDVDSVADFIRKYLTRAGRWNSAKFLAGESYGSTRAAGLAHRLNEDGVVCNGLVLVSTALHLGTLIFETGNDLPYVLHLPTYAATAAYHGALAEAPSDLDAFLREVRDFAVGEYAAALIKGAGIGAEERRAVMAKLSRYTGLSEAWIDRANLRIEIGRFCAELLRERGETVGRLDSRYVGREWDAVVEQMVEDPSFYGPMGPYAATMNDYLRRELGYEEDRRYDVISMEVNEAWNWKVDKRWGYINVAEQLRRVMLQNPHLKVFFANGVYDLATPFFASEYTASHLGHEAHIRANIHEASYPAGHMMYLHEPSLAQLRRDLGGFYEACTKR